MTNKKDIVNNLEVSINILEKALKEREEELRSLLYVREVSSVEDLETKEDYSLGFDLQWQIEDLKEYIEDLKSIALKIGAFKNV